MSRLDQRFEGMGTTLRILLEDDVPGDEPSAALVAAAACARHAIERVAQTLTRSTRQRAVPAERDPRPAVPAGPELRRLVAAALGRPAHGGLVDFTLVDALEGHGYRDALPPAGTSARRCAPPLAGAPRHPTRHPLAHVDVRGTTCAARRGADRQRRARRGAGRRSRRRRRRPGLRAMISCGGDIAVGGGAHEVMVRHPCRASCATRSRSPGRSPRRRSTSGCGSGPAAARRTTCSIRRPASRPGAGCWPRPRSAATASRPRRWPPPRCSPVRSPRDACCGRAGPGRARGRRRRGDRPSRADQGARSASIGGAPATRVRGVIAATSLHYAWWLGSRRRGSWRSASSPSR